MAATAAGLLPIAVGYLIAHYLTYLLIDGQRIVIAMSDPFQRGWNLFDTVFFEPSGAWLPPGLVWTAQLAAVVGGHMLGAWGGHVVGAMEADPGTDARDAAAAPGAAGRRHGRPHDADPVVARAVDRRDPGEWRGGSGQRRDQPPLGQAVATSLG